MKISFCKYQATGNDFIMIDGREKKMEFSKEQVQKICDRRFGIGADGIIILKNHDSCDFDMEYYNADGSQSFCGNGSRCVQAFAKDLGIIRGESYFKAIDGFHYGKSIEYFFATKMGNVDRVELLGDDYFINTGSPHYIKYVDNVDQINVLEEGRAIRNSAKYKKEGTNVNFVSVETGFLKVRTYERGVEDETFSCGTGVTAAAMSYIIKADSSQSSVTIETKGGKLQIDLNRIAAQEFENVWLIGPAKAVFKGEYKL